MSALYLALAVMLSQPAETLAHEGASDQAARDSRPDWVERQSWSEPPVRFRVVTGELWATPEEAIEDALDRAVPIVQGLADESDARQPRAWRVPPRLVSDHLVRKEYLEKVDWTYGPMYRAHLLLELSPETRRIVLAEWCQAMAHQRLSQLGAGLAFVLVCLTSLLGYLRVDEATRGYYTPWLLTGAVAVVGSSAAILALSLA